MRLKCRAQRVLHRLAPPATQANRVAPDWRPQPGHACPWRAEVSGAVPPPPGSAPQSSAGCVTGKPLMPMPPCRRPPARTRVKTFDRQWKGGLPPRCGDLPRRRHSGRRPSPRREPEIRRTLDGCIAAGVSRGTRSRAFADRPAPGDREYLRVRGSYRPRGRLRRGCRVRCSGTRRARFARLR